eukprot:566469-Pyramimonas_sp.AAC.1
MQTPPLRPSVELPMGPRSALLGWGAACEHRHWGHEAPYYVEGRSMRAVPLGPSVGLPKGPRT